MSYLLDTNVVSELRKGSRCNARVAAWFADVAPAEIFLSVLVTSEIRNSIERIRARDSVAARHLERWLARLLADYADRVLPVDARVADRWGRMSAASTLSAIDGLLAATAVVHGLSLVTRNVRHVARTGVDCLDPFSTT